MAQAVIRVGKKAVLSLPALYAPDALAAKRTIEFFTAEAAPGRTAHVVRLAFSDSHSIVYFKLDDRSRS